MQIVWDVLRYRMNECMYVGTPTANEPTLTGLALLYSY